MIIFCLNLHAFNLKQGMQKSSIYKHESPHVQFCPIGIVTEPFHCLC